MELVGRINALFGIMLIVLLIDFGVSLNSGTIVGQAFIVSNIGEIKEDHNLEITEEIKILIKEADELYLAGDVSGAKKKFNELMRLRVRSGGTLSIEKFTELLPRPTNMVFREDEVAKASFFILSENGKLIAEEIKDINKVILTQDAVFKTLFYIFYLEESSSIISPNKKKININGKFYYPDIDSKGKLIIKRFMLYWFDSKVKKDLESAIKAEIVNDKIRGGSFNVLLDKNLLYSFEIEGGSKSLIGRTISWMEEVAIYPN